MPVRRKTAVVRFDLPSGADEVSLPLAVEREFAVILTIEGRSFPAHSFHSPINDEQWREFIRQLRTANGTDPATGDRPARNGNRDAAAIRALARKLYQSLVQISPDLRDFLDAASSPRRLVIETNRPELHLLPWAGMFDETGHLLAAGDLSVVQCWQDFTLQPTATGSRLRLLKILGQDTNQRTRDALTALENTPELEQLDITSRFDHGARGDILHLEKHGDAVTNTTGGIDPITLAANFANVKLALLWSCFSASANSWGDSPALNLHRSGASLVLSFLAELNNDDAGSIAQAFYADVFGPAASRDPESALVRIRAAKAAAEFGWANWASMAVYLRQPLDLSAMPLNGPRVPASAWSAESAPLDGFWQFVANEMTALQPGSRKAIDPSAPEIRNVTRIDPALIRYDQLPIAAFGSWRGNVIRISEAADALPDDSVLSALGLASPEDAVFQQPNGETIHATDPADRLTWFFRQIARFGSPLIVWSGAEPRHLKFLETIQPPTSLTFLLLYDIPLESPSLMEMVDEHRLDEALKASRCLSGDCPDSELSAAYWACARGEHLDEALTFVARIRSMQERLLLMGNYVSRGPKTPLPATLIRSTGAFRASEEPVRPEDFYRAAMNPPAGSDPSDKTVLREIARARHELGYSFQNSGQTETAETLMRQALREIEESGQDSAVRKDSRWYFTLSAILRDLADLLAESADRLDEASTFLRRAMAIQAFHGLRLELAYSTSTAARIALSGCSYRIAIENAIDSANLFESCDNWRGWYGAIRTLFDAFAENRETTRMLSLAQLVNDKLQLSNLPESHLARNRRDLTYQRARAHWIAGDLPEATKELEALSESSAGKDPRVERLCSFLRITSG